MTSRKLYIVLVGLVFVLFAALIGGVYSTSSLLAARADKLMALKTKAAAQSVEQESLNRAKKNIDKYSSLNKIAQAVVPQDKNQAEAVRELFKLANQNNVSITLITFPTSTLGVAPAPKTAASGSATTPSPAAGAANSKASALSQLVPVKTIPGVYQLSITVSNDTNTLTTYDNFIRFLDSLEHNRRTAQVNTISIQPSSTNRNVLQYSLSLTEYIKP